ncbi:MAG: hypothetical protein E7629_03430 [Ruminococcaceae bacterium]|nr:hypothetical protein [Oscillospiraceae bacterium]
MKIMKKYGWEFLLFFSLSIVLSIGFYWVGNQPTDPWVLFGLNAGLLLCGILFIVTFIRLWRVKWKKAIAAGLRKLLTGLASLFIAIVEKWNEAQNDGGHLGGKTSISFDLFRAEKEDKKSAKLPKWKHLQTDRERMRFLYRSMMTERVKRGALVYSSETPSELKQKQENQEHEETLFDLYISHRYDERQQPSEEAIENLKEQFHIK